MVSKYLIDTTPYLIIMDYKVSFTSFGGAMMLVNEQLDSLWDGNLSGETQESADVMKRGLAIMTGEDAGEDGVHLMDNSTAPEPTA